MPSEELRIDADPVRVEQIIVNLLDNAAKYTEQGGRIQLEIRADNDHVVICVKDNGIGIDASMLQQIFRPFVQVNPKVRRESGIGLGLSLTQSLVEMHGGSITAKSGGTSKGSEFTVYLPRVANIVEENVPKKPALVKPLKILIIDDNVDAAESLGKLLTMRGHKTSMAVDGPTGVRRAIEVRPDAILLDIGLPDISGYDVAREMRTLGLHSLLIALTGYGQASDRELSRDAGFDDHLVKPVGLADIERSLAAILP